MIFGPRTNDSPPEIHIGDCRDVLRELPASSVHACVTSPPYWGLRDYGHAGQLGRERLAAQYLRNLVEVFRGVRRVLRADGTCWINLGDTFHEKRLQLLPFRLGEALQEDGWYLRQVVIWQKPNATPESVKDRPGTSHEYLLFLARARQYFYDYEAVREPNQGKPPAVNKRTGGKWAANPEAHGGFRAWNPRGRRQRSVWTVPTGGGFRPSDFGADVDHFAVMPPGIVRPCIRASTSSGGCCGRCGTPQRRLLAEREDLEDIWAPGCSCPPGEIVPATVLDPFAGSGTVGVVSVQEGRRFVGSELNPDYARLARMRLEHAHRDVEDRERLERIRRGERPDP